MYIKITKVDIMFSIITVLFWFVAVVTSIFTTHELGSIFFGISSGAGVGISTYVVLNALRHRNEM